MLQHVRLGSLSVFVFALLGASATARAQDRFEIQVYDAETAPVGGFGVETHVNNVLVGTTQNSTHGELATNHLTHLTLEPHLGLASWCELGFYLQSAYLPDGDIEWGGFKLRFKMRIPRRLAHGLIGLALNVELSVVPSRFEANVFGSELRPVIDLRWKRLYLSFNPIIDIDLAGSLVGRPQLQPALKVAITVVRPLALGVEYYAALGPVTGFVKPGHEVHRLFGVIDVAHRITDKIDFDFNVGAGYNLTGNGDRVVLKAIVGLGH